MAVPGPLLALCGPFGPTAGFPGPPDRRSRRPPCRVLLWGWLPWLLPGPLGAPWACFLACPWGSRLCSGRGWEAHVACLLACGSRGCLGVAGGCFWVPSGRPGGSAGLTPGPLGQHSHGRFAVAPWLCWLGSSGLRRWAFCVAAGLRVVYYYIHLPGRRGWDLRDGLSLAEFSPSFRYVLILLEHI